MELDQKSVVERNMLQNASYEFENGNIRLSDADGYDLLHKVKRNSLSEYLTGVVCRAFSTAGGDTGSV